MNGKREREEEEVRGKCGGMEKTGKEEREGRENVGYRSVPSTYFYYIFLSTPSRSSIVPCSSLSFFPSLLVPFPFSPSPFLLAVF